MKKLIRSKAHKDRFVFFDDEDADIVANHKWHISKATKGDIFYAATNVYNPSTKKYKGITMHRLILGFPNGVTDHRNNNGLDNRRFNLRVCEQHQNAANQKLIQKNNTTGFRGVYLEKKKRLYRAMICVNRVRIGGGRFKSPVDAARRYNELAIKHFGEFAKLNPI